MPCPKPKPLDRAKRVGFRTRTIDRNAVHFFDVRGNWINSGGGQNRGG
jgi:hypothetical protein